MFLCINESLTTEENFTMFAALLRLVKSQHVHNEAMICREINDHVYAALNGFVINMLSKHFSTFFCNPDMHDDMISSVWVCAVR